MNLHSVQRVCDILLVFAFFHGKTNSVVLSDLRRVCVYFFPFDAVRLNTIIPPNGFCTAVASCKEFGYHPKRKDFDYNTFKGGLPYVYVYDHKDWKSVKKKIRPNNVEAFIDKLNKLITDRKIDVMVFDFLETKLNKKYSEEFQTNLKSFFNAMRNDHKNMLFGLTLHRDADKNQKEYNVTIINEAVDFYVVQSYDYNHCVYNYYPDQMEKPPSPDKMQKSINDLRNIGYDVRKLFLTIRIVVRTWKNSIRQIPTDWSYTWMCQADYEEKSRFCRGSLNNFYLQAKVASDNQLPGVFLQPIDFDDYGSTCGCGYFPVAQVIRDGSSGFPENVTVTGCRAFGLLPEEREYWG